MIPSKIISVRTTIMCSFLILICHCSLMQPKSSEAPLVHLGDGIIQTENVKDGDTIHSGFLTGISKDPRIQSIEVAADGGTFQSAEGIQNWKWKLPIGESTWLQETNHTIKIRARLANGQYTHPLEIHVIKGQNLDMDGDGYPEYIENEPETQYSKGKVNILYGQDSPHKGFQKKQTLKSPAAEQYFGHVVGIQDLDQDGYADVVIGSMKDSRLRTYIMKGGTDGVAIDHARVFDPHTASLHKDNLFGVTLFLGSEDEEGKENAKVLQIYKQKSPSATLPKSP